MAPVIIRPAVQRRKQKKNQGGWGDSGREKIQFRGSFSSFSKDINKKLKLQYSGHLMQRADSLGKNVMLGKIEGKRRRG